MIEAMTQMYSAMKQALECKKKCNKITTKTHNNIHRINNIKSLHHSLDISDSCPTGVAHFLFPLF